MFEIFYFLNSDAFSNFLSLVYSLGLFTCRATLAAARIAYDNETANVCCISSSVPKPYFGNRYSNMAVDYSPFYIFPAFCFSFLLSTSHIWLSITIIENASHRIFRAMENQTAVSIVSDGHFCFDCRFPL